jgi:endothelin-converting enzyme/putative endopeptidase
MMKRCLAALLFFALPIAAALTHAQTSTASRPASSASASGLDLQFLDRGVDPCTDFYEFACGGWTKNQPIPADRSAWGRGQELQERNNTTLRRILEEAGRNASDVDTRKIGDYYASCMDERAINARSAAPLEPALNKIAALTGPRDLALLAELHSMGVSAFFSFRAEADFKEANMVRAIADQGGLGLPDRDYYFRDDAKSVELRKQYVEHVGRMIALVRPAGDAAAAANTVMRVETQLAKAALDAVARLDPSALYHKMTPAELQTLTPAFDWATYFKGVGAPRNRRDQRDGAGILQGVRVRRVVDAGGRPEDLPAVAPRACVGRRDVGAVRCRELPVLQDDAHRGERAAAAMAALRAIPTAISAKWARPM